MDQALPFLPIFSDGAVPGMHAEAAVTPAYDLFDALTGTAAKPELQRLLTREMAGNHVADLPLSLLFGN